MGNESKRLAARLIDVRRSVKWVQKDGKNSHQGFSYASSSGVLSSIKEAMDREGVLLVPSVVLAERSERQTRNGGSEILTELRLEYRIINADDPTDTLTVGWYGQGLDTGEKGVGKALTYAEKYFVLKLFNIPTDDADPDADNRPPETERAGTKPAGKKTETAAAAASDGITEPQKRLIFARVRELCPEDSTDDDVRALCTKTAQGMFNTTVSGLTKKQASGVIEWLQKTDYAGLTDSLPF